jgi:hypothetical protein
MSDTPRHDDSQEFRDPTAPTDSSTNDAGSRSGDSGSGSSGDHTSPIETGQTQQVPPVPPARPAGPPSGSAPQNPYAAPPAGAGAPPPPPSGQHPYAAPGAGQPNPYAHPQYPSQGQVQGGYAGAPPYGSAPGAPGYGGATYAAPPSLSGNTIALLVVSGLTTIGCGFGLVGLIFAIVAATKKDRPDESAKYTKWGWIAVVVGFVLSILVIVGIIAIAIANDSGSSYDTGY